MKRHSTLAAVGGIALLAAASMTLGSQDVVAADHADAPGTQADNAADIADFYAWHTDGGKVVAIVTFAPLQSSGAEAAYDRDVLYTIHIDNTAAENGLTSNGLRTSNDNDNESDIQIQVRFGQNFEGTWGVQVENLPGVDGAIQGAVGTMIDGGDGNVAQAGQFDDPFSFDLVGFSATMANIQAGMDMEPQDLAFASVANFFDMDTENDFAVAAPDALAGSNVNAIVVEFDLETALNGNADGLLQMWATASRISE